MAQKNETETTETTQIDAVTETGETLQASQDDVSADDTTQNLPDAETVAPLSSADAEPTPTPDTEMPSTQETVAETLDPALVQNEDQDASEELDGTYSEAEPLEEVDVSLHAAFMRIEKLETALMRAGIAF